jgi:tyrosyl-tRNA synthetase
MPKSQFLKLFHERGFFHQCTDEENLDSILSNTESVGNGTPVYIGFDCTASSLHIGSLVQIMILRWLQKSGHKPIVLLGGGTTKIGDPSGKDESRSMLSDEKIQENLSGIKSVIAKFIDFEDKYDAKTNKAYLVDNDEWLSKLNYIQVLREYGTHFSINKMLTFESVKLRLSREHHLSFLEFNYMILQAIDFVKLYENYGCRLQIGGSDQWGNIVNGIELGRKISAQKLMSEAWQNAFTQDNKPINDEVLTKVITESNNLFGLTTPLITTASGAKMGKTAQGAVWLSSERVSTYDYWQFWRNTEDKDVGKFLRLFTEIPLDEIAKLEKLDGADINKAKIILANAATTICYGEAAAIEAEETARKTFEQGGFGDSLPIFEIAKNELEVGIVAFKLLNLAGLAESGGAAKRLIAGGGAKVNDVTITDESDLITISDINEEGVIKLSSGKKKHVLVRIG